MDIKIRFDEDQIVNLYIAYDLDTCPKNPSNNLKFKYCLFGANNTVKSSDNEKLIYSAYRITFDCAGSWNSDNNFARKVIIFCVNNTSPSNAANWRNNILVLGEGSTFDINGSFGSPEKKFSVNFMEGNRKHGLSLHFNSNYS